MNQISPGIVGLIGAVILLANGFVSGTYIFEYLEGTRGPKSAAVGAIGFFAIAMIGIPLMFGQ